MMELFLTFARIGLFTFGGGYAMLSIIEEVCVEKKKWITHEEMMNITVIAESTPGPIAINCSTYVGFKKAKFVGAVIATMGMVLPSFLVIYFISLFLDNLLEIEFAAKALQGIKLAVSVLILYAGVTMIKKMQKQPFQIGILMAASIGMFVINVFSLKISSIMLMLFSGFFSLMIYFAGKGKREGGQSK